MIDKTRYGAPEYAKKHIYQDFRCAGAPPPAHTWCPFYFPHPCPSNLLSPPLDTYKVCISVVCRNNGHLAFSQSLINHKLTINWPTTTLVSAGVQIAIRAIKHELEAEMWGGRRPTRNPAWHGAFCLCWLFKQQRRLMALATYGTQ